MASPTRHVIFFFASVHGVDLHMVVTRVIWDGSLCWVVILDKDTSNGGTRWSRVRRIMRVSKRVTCGSGALRGVDFPNLEVVDEIFSTQVWSQNFAEERRTPLLNVFCSVCAMHRVRDQQHFGQCGGWHLRWSLPERSTLAALELPACHRDDWPSSRDARRTFCSVTPQTTEAGIRLEFSTSGLPIVSLVPREGCVVNVMCS